MSILHGDFRLFGDNELGNPAAFRHGPKIRAFLRAGADLLISRVFGVDFDGCRVLGRYLVARASARTSFSASDLPISFVFTSDPPDLPVSSVRRLKTNLVPPLCPQEGRDRFLPVCVAQAGFPPSPTAGACR